MGQLRSRHADAVQPGPGTAAEEKVNVLQGHAADQLVARFDDEKSTAVLRQLEKDAVRFDAPDEDRAAGEAQGVRFLIFVPLAKWAMLLAELPVHHQGRHADRCSAVHSDIARSTRQRSMRRAAAPRRTIVPFEKYAAAAQSSHAAGVGGARAQQRRAQYRACRQVQIAAQKGLRNAVIDATVALVDERLAANRKKSAAA